MLDEDRYLAHLCGLADNPSLPAHLLDRLVTVTSGELDLFETPDLPARPQAAAEPPDWIHRVLVTDERLYLARNPAVPASLLWTLASDRGVWTQLAWNPSVPLDLLAEIAEGVELPPVVLPRIASATATELRSLASSPSSQVRKLVGFRRDLPRDVTLRLIADAVPAVVQAVVAAKNPDCTPAFLRDLAQRTPCPEIAQHPNADADTLVACLQVPAARRHAARHPNLPADMITDLLDDPDLLVAEAAAANPALPTRVMEAVLAESR